MPLQRRVPKFGFKNNNKVYFKAINLDALEELAKKTNASALSIKLMIDNGIVGKNDKVKILGRGELKAKVSELAIKDEALQRQGSDLKEAEAELLFLRAALQKKQVEGGDADDQPSRTASTRPHRTALLTAPGRAMRRLPSRLATLRGTRLPVAIR